MNKKSKYISVDKRQLYRYLCLIFCREGFASTISLTTTTTATATTTTRKTARTTKTTVVASTISTYLSSSETRNATGVKFALES